MIKWNRTYTLLSIFVILLLVAIWYYGQLYLIEPERQLLEETETTLLEHQLLIESTQLDDLTIEVLKEEATTIQSQLPTDQNSDQIILMLDDLKEKSDITIHHIERTDDLLQEDQRYYPETISHIRYQIDFSTDSLTNFELFISELNDLERMIEIDQLVFQQRLTNGVSGTVGFRAFYSEHVRLN